eukprot:gene58183-biopygen37304
MLYTLSFPRNCRFWLESETWIHIVSCAPFYLEQAIQSQISHVATVMRVVRLLRLFRVFRAARLGSGRSSSGREIQSFVAALMQASGSLNMLAVMLLVLVSLSSCFIFYFERHESHFDFEQQLWPIAFQSIPDAMWWAIVTSTTVGYGDMYPSTHGGRAIACFTMITSVIILAFPITILTSVHARLQEESTSREQVVAREERRATRMEFYKGIREWLLRGAPL